MKQRIGKICAVYFLLAAAVLSYYFFFKITGHGLQCPFHVITGLYCPGCGNSRALYAFFQLRFGEALRYNYLMPFEVAFVVYVMFRTTAHYFRTGSYKLTIGSEWIGAAFLAVLGIWWIVRNLIGV